MTALKPLENRRVRGVASERYPLNEKCAHPECSEDTADPHHCFPRSQIGGDSWFVSFYMTDDVRDGSGKFLEVESTPIPHVTGLCRAHHDDVEEHRAWIRLEEGEFVWWDRKREPDYDSVPFTGNYGDLGAQEEMRRDYESEPEWRPLGPLNPQPGSREGRPKRKRFKGEARRQRATISIKVPKDQQEDGGATWDEYMARARAALVKEGAVAADEAENYPVFNTVILAIHGFCLAVE